MENDHQGASVRARYGRATLALGAALVAVFALEIAAGRGSVMHVGPDVLARMGGNHPHSTLSLGQYWRLVTAIYLHGGLVHALMNLLALVSIGTAIEGVLGGAWLYFAFVLSGVCGSVLSALMHRANVVAIGASGGIFGLIGLAAVLAWRLPGETGLRKDALFQWLAFGLVIGVVGGFDNYGHLGGVAGGVALAVVVVLLRWKKGVLRGIGLAGAGVALLATVASVALAVREYYRSDLSSILAP